MPMSVAAYLDWQGACVPPRLEFFLIPRVFSMREPSIKYHKIDNVGKQLVKQPTNAFVSSLDEDKKALVAHKYQRVMALVYYPQFVRESLAKLAILPKLYEGLIPNPRIETARNFLYQAFRLWEGGLPNFCHVLLSANYEYCTTTGNDGPVNFPDSVLHRYAKVFQASQLPEKILTAIAERLIVECDIPVVAEG